MTLRAIDLFAGAGGFTAGATAAGARVLWAANHWGTAVAVHAANHPDVEHVTQDLHQADWRRVPAHDLLLASPACQGHSSASRGRRLPAHDASRSTAWAVVSCAEVHRPPWVLVENVLQFARWALFSVWRMALEALGYRIESLIVDAADHGVPQERRRLFIVGSLSGRGLRLPPPRPRMAIEHVLDDDDLAERWAPVAEKPAGVIRRVAVGRRNHGARFLTQHVTGHPGRALDRPIGTVTTKAQWALVAGDRMRMLRAHELRAAMGFPPEYQLPAADGLAIHLLGNAVAPPVAEMLVRAIRRAG